MELTLKFFLDAFHHCYHMKNNNQVVVLPFLALRAGMETSAARICWSSYKEKVYTFQFLCLVTSSKNQE